MLTLEISNIVRELAAEPTLPLEKLLDRVVELVQSMDFANNPQISHQSHRDTERGYSMGTYPAISTKTGWVKWSA